MSAGKSQAKCECCDGSGFVPCDGLHLPGRPWLCDLCYGKRRVRCMSCVAAGNAEPPADVDPLALEFGPRGAK